MKRKLYIPKQITSFAEISEAPFDLMNEVISNACDDINKKREDQIIEALKKRGYIFQNKEQLYEFAKRCDVISYTYNNIKELWYNKELVCIWDETITSHMDLDNSTYKSILTIKVG